MSCSVHPQWVHSQSDCPMCVSSRVAAHEQNEKNKRQKNRLKPFPIRDSEDMDRFLQPFDGIPIIFEDDDDQSTTYTLEASYQIDDKCNGIVILTKVKKNG